MNKEKKRMKKNKLTKFNVKGPEGIEDGLMGMGRAIEAGGPWTHGEMEPSPGTRGLGDGRAVEWRGGGCADHQ